LGVHEGPSFGRFQDATPLSVLVFELLLVAAYRPTLIDEVVLNEGWALFRRGPEPVANPASFDVSASYGTAGRELMRKISRSDLD
jgi:hypothetical protein